MNAPLKIGIAGLGTVGSSVFRLLEEHAALLSSRAQRPVAVTAVSARNKGKDRGIHLGNVKWHDNPVALADDKDVDVVVELMGGAEGAAFDLIARALENNKQVVTANKALLALRGGEVLALLKKSRGGISYEAAVAGGIPIIKGLREGLAANKIRAVYGILNGTCNFILSEMSSTGRDFSDVLKEAQAKGYAEADPSFDVDGIDAGHKLAILAGLAFGCVPDFSAVQTKGIRNITPLDIEFAEELGYRIKLLGIARQTEKGIEQSMEPCLVPKSSPIAHVEGALNAVYADGDYVGKILMMGAGAGGKPTASAVVADIIDVARGRTLPLLGLAPDQASALKPANISERIGSYFLRLIVLDQPGVIADVSAILRDCHVSLESVLQRGRSPGQPVPVILTSHETPEGDMLKAVGLIGKLKSVVEPPHLMRIETFGSG
ncbi:MAG: homoserine dehydrogenase [Alphaproteobacteria bacterium]|nr:homoserine dehydrogenase [Alphaproteobacteria bacterium]